jgi:hypothetical protein
MEVRELAQRVRAAIDLQDAIRILEAASPSPMEGAPKYQKTIELVGGVWSAEPDPDELLDAYKRKVLKDSDGALREGKAPKEWHEFAEAMFAKAKKHLEKYPEDKIDAWNDKRFGDGFWSHRLHDEIEEWERASPLGEPEELLDISNICLFLYFYRHKQFDKLARRVKFTP